MIPPLRRLVSRVLFLSALSLVSVSRVLGSIGGGGGELKDPRGLLLSFATADACVIVRGDVKDTVPSMKGRVWTPVADDSSVLVEDAAVVAAIVQQLRPLDLKPSSICFCIGDPVVRFFHQNTYLGSVCVEHDDNLQLVDGSGASGYFTGRANLVREFYEVVSPLLKRAKEAAAAAAVKAPAHGVVVEGQEASLKQAAAGELRQQEDYVRQLPVPAIEVPVAVESKKRE